MNPETNHFGPILLTLCTPSTWNRFLRRAVWTWQRANLLSALVRDTARRAALATSFSFFAFVTLHTQLCRAVNVEIANYHSQNSYLSIRNFTIQQEEYYIQLLLVLKS
jgi:hypothetical protein